MTIAMCAGPEKVAEQLLFPRPFGTFCGNAKKYIKKVCVCQRKLLQCFKHSFVTFFACPKKVTKEKAGRFNADHSLKLTLKLMNRPEQQSEVVKVQVQHSASCYTQQREALVFSLDHSKNRMIVVNEKKALNQFNNLKCK